MDDRRLIVRLERPGRFRGSAAKGTTLDISFVPSALGARLRDDGGHQLAGLGGELRNAGPPREVLPEAQLEHAARSGDLQALLRGRWMSHPLADWLLRSPHTAVTLYREICQLGPARPARCGTILFPFPVCETPVMVDSLIHPETYRGPLPSATKSQVTRRQRTLQRMRAELDRAANAPELRRIADSLVAMGSGEPPDSFALADGSSFALEAKPGQTAAQTAKRLYARARSMERAASGLPERIAALEQSPDAPEPARHVDSKRARVSSRSNARARSAHKTYTSSGGLAIWVGRGAASNDELTFGDAAPNDVWLHARDAAGAHVVLRWQSEDAPPARDLEEAAILAAWHSKMRGSALVPVDWTRRKHVRKAKGGKPGVVVVTRLKTVMVRPTQQMERALRPAAR